MMIDCIEMLNGFKKQEGNMYEEELKDLELAYEKTLESVNNKMDILLPSLVHYMKEFVDLYETKYAVEEKLSTLKAKMGDEDGNEA